MLLQSKRSFKYNCRHYKYDIICMAKEPYKFTIFTYYYRKKNFIKDDNVFTTTTSIYNH